MLMWFEAAISPTSFEKLSMMPSTRAMLSSAVYGRPKCWCIQRSSRLAMRRIVSTMRASLDRALIAFRASRIKRQGAWQTLRRSARLIGTRRDGITAPGARALRAKVGTGLAIRERSNSNERAFLSRVGSIRPDRGKALGGVDEREAGAAGQPQRR